MIRISLPPPERERLQHLFRSTPDRKLRDRSQTVLLGQRGRPHQDIARDLGVTARTVQRWLNAYLERGLDGLRSRKAEGAAPRLTADLAPVLRQWAIGGPVAQGLDRANWTYAELADRLFKTRGVRVQKSAMQAFCSRHGVRPYRPTYRFLRGDAVKQAAARDDLAALKKAAAGELVLLSQDEAHLPMVPTLRRTLGVKGHRLVVGTWDRKHLLYVFASVNVVSCAMHTDTVESRTGLYRATGDNKTRRLQRGFAEHLRRLGRRHPKDKHPRVVVLIDNAPWHAGEAVRRALAEHPQPEVKRLPSYSPQLNVIERFWKLLRRRATHNRLFDRLADLKRSIRNSVRYFQTVRRRIGTLIANCHPQPINRTPLTRIFHRRDVF